MATRSTIAVQLNDGSIKQVYCHWDGYIEHNGKLLVENYNTAELADALVSLGDISSLCPRYIPSLNVSHTYDEPEEGVTVFYGRDRGEDEVKPALFGEYKKYARDGRREEYNYLFREGRWECSFNDNNGVVIVSKYLNRVL